jgi:hypothetical protein
MHLPTPQFSRLITVLAFDLSNPSLDSMFIAWDHIATRYLKRLETRSEAAGRIESIRLLAVHDAVISILGHGAGFVFNGISTGTTLSAAMAATARASHDILANVFTSEVDLADLDHALEESLSLVSDEAEKAFGSATGSASAEAFLRTFGYLEARPSSRPADRFLPVRGSARFQDADRPGMRKSA